MQSPGSVCLTYLAGLIAAPLALARSLTSRLSHSANGEHPDVVLGHAADHGSGRRDLLLETNDTRRTLFHLLKIMGVGNLLAHFYLCTSAFSC